MNSLILVDRSFPGFDKAFDVDVIKRCLIEEGLCCSVLHVAIGDVRFEPDRECVLKYRVKDADSHEKIFACEFLPSNEEVKGLPEHAVYLKRLHAVIHPFPFDPRLPWLSSLVDKTAVQELLRRRLKLNQYEVCGVDIDVLSYTPLMRATFGYTIEIRNGATDEIETWKWVAKTNAHKSAHQVFANYWAIWKSSGEGLVMPKPEGFCVSPPVTFQRQISGTRLGALVGSEHFEQFLVDTGKAIARFHSAAVPLCGERNFKKEERTLTRWSDVLVQLLPETKQRLVLLRSKILEEMKRRIVLEAPVHADFHHTNILVDGLRVQLIDMDEMALGDPCVDVGRFLSSLRVPFWSHYGSFEKLMPFREAFLHSYLEHSKRNIGKVHLFEAASLFTSAAAAFRNQKKDWKKIVDVLLDEAERVFSEAKRILSRSRIRKAGKKPFDRASWVQDGEYMKALLAPRLFELYGEEILNCCPQTLLEYDGFFLVPYRLTCLKKKRRKERHWTVIMEKGKPHAANEGLPSNDAQRHTLKRVPPFPEPVAHLRALDAFVMESGNRIEELLSSHAKGDFENYLMKCMSLTRQNEDRVNS